MKFIDKKKIKKFGYDLLLIILGLAIPALGVLFLGAWEFVRELMQRKIPFWILFLTLLVLGFVVVRFFLNRKKVGDLKKIETVLHNNLVYKKSDKDFKEPFCPVCYEQGGKFVRMRIDITMHFDQDYHRFECFVCNYREEIKLEDEIPF